MSFLAFLASQVGAQVRINSGTTVPYRDSDYPEDHSRSENLDDTKLEDEDIEHDVETLEDADDRAFIAVEDVCGICQEPCQDPAIIDCKHTFCVRCLYNWVDIASTCPNCRRELTAINGNPIESKTQRVARTYLEEEEDADRPPPLLRRSAPARADLSAARTQIATAISAYALYERPPVRRNPYFG